jgi:hypothetical protein
MAGLATPVLTPEAAVARPEAAETETGAWECVGVGDVDADAALVNSGVLMWGCWCWCWCCCCDGDRCEGRVRVSVC